MTSLVRICRLGMRVAAVLALPAAAFALTSPSITDLSNDAVETPQQLPSPTAPLTAPAVRVQPKPAPSANPLWGIPLKLLTNTRDRPIFSSSRRPPPPATVGPPVAAVPPSVQKPKVPEQPQLSLLGTIVDGDDGYGIFMDQSNKVPLRIRIGASYQGWTLRSIKSGAVMLEKDQDSAMLAFPKSAAESKGGLVRSPAAGASLTSQARHPGIGQPPVPRPALPVPRPVGNEPRQNGGR
jgi:general secretion pathway protein N